MAKFSLGQSVGVSIQTGEIDDAAVTNEKLAPSAVTNGKITNATIALAKLAMNSVDASKIVANSITKDELNAGAETALQVLRLNAAADGIEWGTAALNADDNITIQGTTLTLKKWLIAL